MAALCSHKLSLKYIVGVFNLHQKISILVDLPWDKMKQSMFWIPLRSFVGWHTQKMIPFRSNLQLLRDMTKEEKHNWLSRLIYGRFSSGRRGQETIEGLVSNHQRQLCLSNSRSFTDGRFLNQEDFQKHRINNKNMPSNMKITDNLVNRTSRSVDSIRVDKIQSQIKKENSTSYEVPLFNKNKSHSQLPIGNYHSNMQKATPNVCSTPAPPYCQLSRSFHKTSFPKLKEEEATADDKGGKKTKKKNYFLNSFSSEAIMLQPAKGDFSIEKLISKIYSTEKIWGIPRGHNFVRSTGPGINDNLIEFTEQQFRNKSNSRKVNNFFEHIKQNHKVKSLIKKAKDKNKEHTVKRLRSNIVKSKPNKVYRTVLDSVSGKPADVLKTKEKKLKRDVAGSPRKTEQLELKNKESEINGECKENLEEEILKVSRTEYQPSASYKNVFQELFSRSYGKKQPSKAILNAFNRQSLPSFRTISLAANKPSPENQAPCQAVSKLSKHVKGSAVQEPKTDSSVNLKAHSRTPFQKAHNCQLSPKSKASFSTVSKIDTPLGIGISELIRKTKQKISSTMLMNQEEEPKIRSYSDVKNIRRNSKLPEIKKETKIDPMVKKTLYSTLGYYPSAMEGTVSQILQSASKPTKYKDLGSVNTSIKKEKSAINQVGYPSDGYFSQRRSLSICGPQNQSYVTRSVSDTSWNKNCDVEKMKRDLHTSSPTQVTYRPLHDEVFTEVMHLCKARKNSEVPKATKVAKETTNEVDNGVKDYGRCSLDGRKPERRRGFVCKLASMFNIGCGRRKNKRMMPRGCHECRK